MQGPTLDAKLAAMGLNGLASSVCQLFVEASPTGESCIVLQSGPTCSLVQGRRKQSPDGQAQLDVGGEVVNNSRAKRAAKI